MKNSLFKFSCLFLSLMALASCGKHDAKVDDGNSIYYWRTTFTLNDAERKYIKKHDINKLYVRFFDVDWDWEGKTVECVVPNATIQFKDSVPAGIEVVPTIYINNSAMEQMQLKEDEYAEKILKRVTAICRRHKIEFKEVQLDCDWTQSTRQYFYDLCKEMKQLMDSTQTLSSTIRLHQLIQTPPPVDKGVLMVYNTGDLMELTTNNSIFSYDDIAPYLRDKRLADYKLPLDVAYPTFGWSVVFRRDRERSRFVRLMRRTEFSKYRQIKEIGKNLYEVLDEVDFAPQSNTYDRVHDKQIIRVERPKADEILKVKRLIDQKLNDKPHHNILYHLDESQFSHYKDNEIDKIYSRD